MLRDQGTQHPIPFPRRARPLCRNQRPNRHHGPIHRLGDANSINEAKRAQRNESVVGRSRKHGPLADERQGHDEIRVRSRKHPHLFRVRPACGKIGPGRQQPIVERLNLFKGEDWYIDHAQAPLLGSKGTKTQCKAPNSRGQLGHKRHSACERESADHRHPASRDERRPRQGSRIPIAVEPASRARSFRVRAPKARMTTVDISERSDNPTLSRPV
jgi:hypothetical protein